MIFFSCGVYFTLFAGSSKATAATTENIYTSAPSMANVAKDIHRAVLQSIQNMGIDVDLPEDETENGETSYLSKVFQVGKWNITRGIFWGIDDLDQSAEYISSQKEILAAEYVAYQNFATGTLHDRREIFQQAMQMSPEELESAIARIAPLQQKQSAIQMWAQSMKAMEPFFEQDSIYAKVAKITSLLVILFLFVSLIPDAVALVMHDDTFKTRTMIMRFGMAIAAIVIIRSAPYMIMAGIQISDGVRYFVTGGLDLGDAVMQMLDAKVEILGLSDSFGVMKFSLLAFVAKLSYYLAASIIYILFVLADISMAILAIIFPISVAISLIPVFRDTWKKWLQGYLAILIWMPLSAIYTYIMLLIVGTMSTSSSLLAFSIVCIAYAIGAAKIPALARDASAVAVDHLVMQGAMIPASMATMGGHRARAAVLQTASSAAGLGVGKVGKVINKSNISKVMKNTMADINPYDFRQK